MGERTGIAWTDHSFNPWIGCTKVHAGCTRCYAEKLATTRLGREWGPSAVRQVTADANWKQPMRWARAAAKAGERRRVFCASLADVLDEEAPKEAQARLWELIRDTHRVSGGPGILGTMRGGLDWLLLTKRPERWEIIPADVRPLVWLGTSISDQTTAEEWLPRLLAAKGFRIKFASVEPLIGPVHLDRLHDDELGAHWNALTMGKKLGLGLDWVIVGGESGSGARRCHTEWVRDVIEQCAAAGVPCFTKQLGANPVAAGRDQLALIGMQDKKGGDPSEWPADLRVRRFPVQAG